jgi:hypothetical protein
MMLSANGEPMMVDAVLLESDPGRAADQVARSIRETNSLDEAYAAFEIGLAQIQAEGLPLESLVPTEASDRFLAKLLGRKPKDGKTFWAAYKEVVGQKLCDPKSEFRKLCDKGTVLGAGGLVSYVMAALALPVSAIAIGAGIAGLLAAMGIEAFCRSTEPNHGTEGGS